MLYPQINIIWQLVTDPILRFTLRNSGTGSPFRKTFFNLVKNDIFISALNINNTADIQQKLYTIHTKNELLSWDEQKVMMTGGGKGRV